MVNADAVGEDALQLGDDGSAYDGGDQQAGGFAGERAHFGDAQREDAGEHDGVEEADEQDAPDGDVAEGEHRNDDQQRGDRGTEREQLSGLDFSAERPSR